MAEPAGNDSHKIVDLTLDERTVARRSPEIEHERRVAIFDLLEDNHFAPKRCGDGPYHLRLSIEEGRLILEINDTEDAPLDKLPLPITPFRRLIKDYFTVCESYYAAIKTAPPSQIEAIDMGRRALHNEGSEMLRERLDDRVHIDLPTARRLFTLLCVLHLKG